jgi:hypothetical protein
MHPAGIGECIGHHSFEDNGFEGMHENPVFQMKSHRSGGGCNLCLYLISATTFYAPLYEEYNCRSSIKMIIYLIL